MPKVVKSFRLSEELIKKLSDYSEVHKEPMPSVVEKAVEAYLLREQYKDAVPGWNLVTIPVSEDIAVKLQYYPNFEELNDYLEAKLKQAHKEEFKTEVPLEQLSEEEQLERFNF